MARNSEFPENGRGPESVGGGTSDDTQCSPLPKACQIKRPRESDGDTVMVDAVEPIRKKAATTMAVSTIGSALEQRTDEPRPTGSPPPSPSKRRVRFQHPSGILKHPKPPREQARSRESRRAGWRETPPGSGRWTQIQARAGSGQIRSDTDPDTDSVLPEHDGSLEEQRAARYAAELYATQTAQALQQAHMGQQALAEERAARLAAERIAEQLSYMMQQEAWGRRALEDRIVTGSKELEQLRQAASRCWTEAQDTLTTQTTKLAQLQEENESYAQQGTELDARSQELTKQIERLKTAAQHAEERTKATAAAATLDAWKQRDEYCKVTQRLKQALERTGKELAKEQTDGARLRACITDLERKLHSAATDKKKEEAARLSSTRQEETTTSSTQPPETAHKETSGATSLQYTEHDQLPGIATARTLGNPSATADMGQMKKRASMPQGTASVETPEDMETAKITKTTTAAPAEALLTLEETRGNITIRLLSQSYEVIRDIWYKRISTERPPQELSASTVLSLLAGTEEKSCVTFASRRNATEVKTALTLTGEVLTRAIIRAKRQAQTWAPTDADDPHPWYEALFSALQEAEDQMAAPRLRAWRRQHPISPNSAREAILRYRNDLEWENRMDYWESHDGRILEVAIIIAENVARAQARRLDPDVGASATAPDNAPRTGSASTPEIDEEESARKKDDPAATRSTEDMDGAPNNHEAGRNHDKGNLGNGAAIETEENKNKGDDKASPAHPAPSATTAAAKEARESDEDAVTSRAATPDQKKEVATKQAGKDTSREETATSADKPPMTAQKTVIADGASTLHADEHHDIQEDKADGVEPKDTPKNGIETTTAPASGLPAANADTDGAPAPDPISTTDRGSEASQPNESRPYTAKRKSPPPGTAPSAREDTPVTTGVAPLTHNNRFALLATQSDDEDGDSNESEFHTSAEETTPNAGPVPQENQQPPVHGEALVEIKSRRREHI